MPTLPSLRFQDLAIAANLVAVTRALAGELLAGQCGQGGSWKCHWKAITNIYKLICKQCSTTCSNHLNSRHWCPGGILTLPVSHCKRPPHAHTRTHTQRQSEQICVARPKSGISSEDDAWCISENRIPSGVATLKRRATFAKKMY